MSATVAERLAAGVEPFVGGELPVRLRAWDGSEAGPVDAPRVVINSPDALRRLIWRPGELGAAQAYVSGEIDVEARPRRRAHPRVGGRAGARAVRESRPPRPRSPRCSGVVREFRPRPPAGGSGQPGASCAAGCTPSCATGRRSATTTTSPTTSTR